jgi:hypothetical protein
MYYFQMYGSRKGQTWHEMWSTADRRVINPLTQVYGRPYSEVWTEQLANIPKLSGVTDETDYGALLIARQKLIEDAPSREEALKVYRGGLVSLVHNRFVRYAQRAQEVAVDSGVGDWTSRYELTYRFVVPQIDRWLGSGGPPPAGSKLGRVFAPKSQWPVHSAALSHIRQGIVAVHTYYTDRFPEEDLKDQAARTTATVPPKAKSSAAMSKKVAKYLRQGQSGPRYDDLRQRHAHYAGEEVDASNNPVIKDGRKGVADLRTNGMDDAAIRTTIKKLFPAYSIQDIDTYFMDSSSTPKVAYLDSTSRADYELHFEGKIKQQGKTFDTSDMFSSGAGSGYSIFVMSPGGEIYANEHKPGLFHHSSFLAGLPTAAAGEVQVKKGKLTQLTNKSGHYHPGAAQTYQVVSEIKEKGLAMSGYGVKIAGIPAENPESKFNADYPSARDFADEWESSKR